jgi:hypothetical protein
MRDKPTELPGGIRAVEIAKRISYLAAVGRIHEHRQGIEAAGRRRRVENVKRDVVISSVQPVCQIRDSVTLAA